MNPFPHALGIKSGFCIFLFVALVSCKKEPRESPSSKNPPERHLAKPASEAVATKPASEAKITDPAPKDEYVKPHSILIYKYKNVNGDEKVLRIYSWLGVRDGESLKYETLQIVGIGRYQYENGTSIAFKDGTVICGEKQFENLFGNYIFSDRGLTEGFIRNFD